MADTLHNYLAMSEATYKARSAEAWELIRTGDRFNIGRRFIKRWGVWTGSDCAAARRSAENSDGSVNVKRTGIIQ